MNIVQSNYYSFEEYREVVDKYVNTDAREINFQNRVVLQLLDRVLLNESNITIVDVSTQFQNKEVEEKHTRKFYAWHHTPDLLIVKDWNYVNWNKSESDYLAVVEIKSPILGPIREGKKHTQKEIDEFRSKTSKVILTDCYEWVFYHKGEEKKHFYLHNGKKWNVKSVNNPEFVIREFGFQETREVPDEWDELISYIQSFLTSKKFKLTRKDT